ncbi:glycoside hydrolase family 3 protein [Curtobacterium sp. MCJR17_020]|uniref:beta-glucosidase n=1 Tax=Curtobacterium sp. MCJR17_020 TaxID=2175619 RepID=UPI0021ACA9B9|nr:glycoside hydrolase family 3 protein [Curtobacterium sp. MCJR17_020]WIE70422.1 beta-glucosidase [Curtobacterium sp. MCJR17_020]
MTDTMSDRADAAVPEMPETGEIDRLRAALTTGADYWTTPEALGVRSLRLADGPHGLRVQDDENPDHLGLERSAPATCFPPAVTLASSWDPELVEQVGAALGREARGAGVDIVLGPGLNIKRSPLCGRNFEYMSEDPLLAGVMAGAMVNGLQGVGVAACLKHFAANNQETDRLRVSAEIDERTLREIYLRAFQIAVVESTPWSVMSAYNRINGVFASENRWLLTDVLRQEWGFDGVVVSDWGAVHDPVAAVAAGLDLRMPGRPEDPRVAEALADGALDGATVDASIQRLRLLADRTRSDGRDVPAPDLAAHHELTRRAGAESAVLLTNDGVLPVALRAGLRVAVLGELARAPRYQGAGSSRVNPTRVVTAVEELTRRAHAAEALVEFVPGYSLERGATTEEDLDAAVAAAQRADVVLLFLGLPGEYEAEGRDRTDIDLPADQLELLERLRDVDTPVVASLSNGSAVTTAGWRGAVNAIVEFWLTGQANGETIADVLLGDANPGGKLAETIPVRLEDTPSFSDFPGEHGTVRYSEGVHVGYRWYATRDVAVDHAFGHGLSYTEFAYEDLRVDVRDEADDTAFEVVVRLRNVGGRAGSEVVQVYVTDETGDVTVPALELRGWSKVRLDVGETKDVRVPVRRETLRHWHTGVGAWVFGGGPLVVHVGGSSAALALDRRVLVPGTPVVVPLTPESTFAEWLDHPEAGPRLTALIDERGGLGGRIGDLYADEAGRDSAVGFPLATIVEFPGVPLVAADVDRLLREIG